MVNKINKKKINYEPNDKEEFMNPKQVKYFKNLLQTWKNDLLQESSNTLDHLKEESSNKPDNADRASIESERSLELRTRDRERKLLNKINKALRKIDEGTYGTKIRALGVPVYVLNMRADFSIFNSIILLRNIIKYYLKFRKLN